jgi:hypothetical protein
LLFAACTFFAATAAGQVGSAIEPPATTNKDTAVDLAPLAVATIKQVAFADSDIDSRPLARVVGKSNTCFSVLERE